MGESIVRRNPTDLHFTAVNKMVSMYCSKQTNMVESNGEPVTILRLENCLFKDRKHRLDTVAYLSKTSIIFH